MFIRADSEIPRGLKSRYSLDIDVSLYIVPVSARIDIMMNHHIGAVRLHVGDLKEI